MFFEYSNNAKPCSLTDIFYRNQISSAMIFLISTPGGDEWIFVFVIVIVAMRFLPNILPPKYLSNDKIPLVEVLVALLLLITFFLPWARWGILVTNLSISGYDIPIRLKELVLTTDLFSRENTDEAMLIVYVSYLLYTIPLFSFATIFFGLNKKNKTSNYFARLASVIPVLIGTLAIFIFASKSGFEASKLLDFGFYAMIFLGFSLWANSMWTGRVSVTDTMTSLLQPETLLSEESKIDRSSLLNQLAQLHSLKENEVISESIYEFERKEILSQLHKFEGPEYLLAKETFDNTSYQTLQTDTPSLNDWLKSNKGKSINDYYVKFRKPSI